ncbi:MAG: hypothetical protein E7264_01430 [Lachnospiraceae bacterium]|nr:hypothetical protein [Lachnospiraceae bacterium]
MRFTKVILVGSGKIACDCLRYMITIVAIKDIVVLESQNNQLSMLANVCKKENISYSVLENKKDIEQFMLAHVENERTLIVSANNRFIFTPQIIQKEYVEIINFHYALLPRYRGMNIPTWVIYNGEKETGITWHFVTEQVDKGKIIAQRTIPINDMTNALEVTRKGMLLGIEAFESFIAELLDNKMDGMDVLYPEEDVIYYNSQLPMAGVIDLNQSIEDISRLLRSFDYGGMKVIPYLRLYYNNNCYEVQRYKLRKLSTVKKRMIEYKEDTVFVKDVDGEIELYLKPFRND